MESPERAPNLVGASDRLPQRRKSHIYSRTWRKCRSSRFDLAVRGSAACRPHLKLRPDEHKFWCPTVFPCWVQECRKHLSEQTSNDIRTRLVSQMLTLRLLMLGTPFTKGNFLLCLVASRLLHLLERGRSFTFSPLDQPDHMHRTIEFNFDPLGTSLQIVGTFSLS